MSKYTFKCYAAVWVYSGSVLSFSQYRFKRQNLTNLGRHCRNLNRHWKEFGWALHKFKWALPTPPTSRASLDEISYFSYLASLHLYFCNTSQFSCMFNCLDRNQIKANFWPAFFFLDYKQGSGCSPVLFWSYSGHKFTKVVMLLAFLCL